MAKLYFRYGAMGSSKSAQVLMTKFNYEEKGKYVWLIKPAIDTRGDVVNPDGRRKTLVKSRIGLSSSADVIGPDENVLDAFYALNKRMNVDPANPPETGLKIDAIIVDEAQFCSETQVDALKYIAEYYDISVLCYGLRSDFQTKLFPGSKRLFELADSISEIKSICSCGKKSIVNARLSPDGQIITEGDQIDIGGNEKYEGMCWKCWRDKIEKQKGNSR